MSERKEMEVMRMREMKDLDILNPAEQDEVLGGDTETQCQKGYSTFLWTSCECGYKETVVDENDNGDEPEEP